MPILIKILNIKIFLIKIWQIHKLLLSGFLILVLLASLVYLTLVKYGYK